MSYSQEPFGDVATGLMFDNPPRMPVMVLEALDIEPDQATDREDLFAGLPMPDKIWDEQ